MKVGVSGVSQKMKSLPEFFRGPVNIEIQKNDSPHSPHDRLKILIVI